MIVRSRAMMSFGCVSKANAAKFKPDDTLAR
jgi:hypothetical protein